MSRIGKMPIELPQGTGAEFKDGKITVKGPKGQLSCAVPEPVKVNITDKEITVDIPDKDDKKEKALWGLVRSLINNLVAGVNNPFEKKLEINGVGYRASVGSGKLTLNVGFSHPVEFALPEGISAQVEKNVITISGIDKQLVGETAASIRRIKKPEPYKGKGIKYADEIVRRKAGKSAAKGSKK